MDILSSFSCKSDLEEFERMVMLPNSRDIDKIFGLEMLSIIRCKSQLLSCTY